MDLEPESIGATPELSGVPRLSIDHQFGLVIELLPIALVLTGPGGSIEIVNRRGRGHVRLRPHGTARQFAGPFDP